MRAASGGCGIHVPVKGGFNRRRDLRDGPRLLRGTRAEKLGQLGYGNLPCVDTAQQIICGHIQRTGQVCKYL